MLIDARFFIFIEATIGIAIVFVCDQLCCLFLQSFFRGMCTQNTWCIIVNSLIQAYLFCYSFSSKYVECARIIRTWRSKDSTMQICIMFTVFLLLLLPVTVTASLGAVLINPTLHHLRLFGFTTKRNANHLESDYKSSRALYRASRITRDKDKDPKTNGLRMIT